MTERFCYREKLGSCCDCPNVELFKQEKMANPNVEPERIVAWVSESECPSGMRLKPPDDQPRKISSSRFLNGR